MPSSPVVDVIIPAYNEALSIGRVIADIPKDIVRNIIVCDNNSTDDTSGHARLAGAIVTFQPQRGYGNACQQGIDYIRKSYAESPPDIVVFMDADYADDPSELSNLVNPLLHGKDLVIGSRTIGNPAPGSLTIPQQFGNWLATHLIKIVYGFRFTDLGPFRAIRWNKLLLLNMKDKNYGWTVEMQVKALHHDLQCAEVPVSYRKRIGKSKISGTLSGSVKAGMKIIWTILKSK